jgi:hypothetical protein
MRKVMFEPDDVVPWRGCRMLRQRVDGHVIAASPSPGQQFIERLIGQAGRVEAVGPDPRDSLLFADAEHAGVGAE